MESKEVNKALLKIIEKRMELALIDYANEAYDEIEDQLHDLEDEFLDNFGEELEDGITKVHKKLCPSSDVLLPIAYIAKNYYKPDSDAGNVYMPEDEEGVRVDIKGFEDEDTRLVFVPNPVRLLMIINSKTNKEVWKV